MPVVDASVVVDWVAPRVDAAQPAGRLLAGLARQGERVYAPRLLSEEVANALVTGIRRGWWTGAEADVAFTVLRRLPLYVVDSAADLDRAWELSRRYDEHPISDMIYVATAERLGQRFVTADAGLAERLAGAPFVDLLG